MKTLRSRDRISRLLALLAIALCTMGGTCVVVEEGPDGYYDDMGNNEEAMIEQEERDALP